MKNALTTAILAAIFLFVSAFVNAQDSSGLKKQLNTSNEKADNLHGKKIQQQSLSTGKFENLDTAVPPKPVVKQKKKNKRKQKHQ